MHDRHGPFEMQLGSLGASGRQVVASGLRPVSGREVNGSDQGSKHRIERRESDTRISLGTISAHASTRTSGVEPVSLLFHVFPLLVSPIAYRRPLCEQHGYSGKGHPLV